MRIKSDVAHMRPHDSLMRKMPGNPNDAVEYNAISNGRKDVTRNDGQKYGHTSMHAEVRTEGCKVINRIHFAFKKAKCNLLIVKLSRARRFESRANIRENVIAEFMNRLLQFF